MSKVPKFFYVGVKGVLVSDGAVLLLQRSDENSSFFWDFPGGRIENNESIEDTLIREVKEELPSIEEFRIQKLLGAYRLERDLESGVGLCLLYYKMKTELFKVKLSDEHTSFQWFSREELANIEKEKCFINLGNLQAARAALSS